LSYTVYLSSRAERDRRKLPEDIRQRIDTALLELERDPRPPNCVKLKGIDEWRIRVGDYRIRYRIDDKTRTVTITRIAHRREVYEE
jgi:mRNA interferase RelE/StbE